ncbi:MAG: pantoate--beta-alanine ligase [Sporocytophaga sp.]|uniref:pantoate--beta-alanine ligase n=1 Tax=Sporocytophaga sp. TaxID=2231183 RepID=UPI001B2F094E|nr:pantoate--beta-alanine ligase [Sporocytophaga sp.]MBO9698991.1 pantoate--beta-alanine ligase [Sporocytophaga sp.]
MEIIKEPSELIKYIKRRKPEFKSIGFVPTMGALHQGHISLIECSKKENDFTICSIFVNPIQFNNAQDFILYPKNQEEDFKMLENAGCDLVFMPSAEVMYTEEPRIKIDFGSLELVMEGKFRPGHFNGVAIVVAKLFHIVQPDISYFGQKDLQQYLIIKQMVKDLSFPIELRSCPVIREKDGLAMSSRNQRLTPKGRPIAAKLNESLLLAAKLLENSTVESTKAKIRDFYKNIKEIKLEYFEITDSETLMPIKDVKEHKGIAICVAAYLDGVRLIDNILI